MKVLQINLIILNIILLSRAEDQLIGVAVVFRHGDRIPITTYPTDPYRNESYWPVGWGQLTNAGKERQYQLGEWLRQRYSKFLPSKYSEKDIHITSTDVDRTLMSASANLAGLYPPQDDQIWNSKLIWQPIPIHTRPQHEDNFLAMKKHCPKHDFLLEELFNTQYFKDILQSNAELMNTLTHYTGINFTALKDFEHINGVWDIEQNYFNYTLPEWTKGIFPQKTNPLAGLSFASYSYTDELARLKGGLFYNNLIDFFLNKTSGVESVKFLMFSAHDTTVANLLSSLKAFEPHCPHYGSTIIYELWQKNKISYVKVFYYKNNGEEEPMKVKVRDCAEFDCKLEDFIDQMKNVTVTEEDWDKICFSDLKN